MLIGKYIVSFIFLCMNGIILFGQNQSGKIVYERKTNLAKKFNYIQEDWMTEFLETNKYKIDVFELYFTDSSSIFKPEETDEEDPNNWATYKNTVYQNFNTQQKTVALNLGGQDLLMVDVITNRKWKIIDGSRMIGKYQCRRAVWEMNDSTTIYAWFSTEILPPVGPEGFNGLPGAILGLATEDGGVIYFAKSVELVPLKNSVFEVKSKKKQVFSYATLKTKLEEEFKDYKESNRVIGNVLNWL